MKKILLFALSLIVIFSGCVESNSSSMTINVEQYTTSQNNTDTEEVTRLSELKSDLLTDPEYTPIAQHVVSDNVAYIVYVTNSGRLYLGTHILIDGSVSGQGVIMEPLYNADGGFCMYENMDEVQAIEIQ